jgi:DNA polymerase elongation subunit (family B)
MITERDLKSMLFFDIETCGNHATFKDFVMADPDGAKIWEKKAKRLGYEDYDKSYEEKVSLFPEFGRIACFSFGTWSNGNITVKSINDLDELTTMKLIGNLLRKASVNDMRPIGWNIKNFDLPWLVRKFLIHGLEVPQIIQTYGKKPWEVNTIDLKDMWKSFSNLDVTFEEAVYSMGVPTPKDDIDGSQVHETIWNETPHGLLRVTEYCEKDVKAMIQLCEKIHHTSYPKITV